MAENPIYVTIEMRPYLVEYFKHYYGEHPIKANEKSKIFPLLAEYLTHTPSNYRPIPEGPRAITFELPYNRIIDIRRNNYISPNHFSEIQSFFYGMFYVHFVQYMDKHCLFGHIPFKSAIIAFMEDHNISFDTCQYDSLKRLYFRHRIKFRKKPEK
jgi:hypothetical protein